MSSKYGKCHICGQNARLTFEHVPPSAAFNSNRAFMAYGNEVFGRDQFPWDLSGVKQKQLQRGIGNYTLCGRCNSITGSWYADAFVDFTYKGYKLTYDDQSPPNRWATVTLPNIYPLQILKEIVAMFFSINNPNLSDIHKDLQSFVLSKEKRGISPEKYGFYLYVLRGSIIRYIGIAGIMSSAGARVISELSAPPFGYVFEINPKDKSKYCDLTFFGNDFEYDEQRTLTLKIPILESNTGFPLDYRTKKQVMDAYVKNKMWELQQKGSL